MHKELFSALERVAAGRTAPPPVSDDIVAVEELESRLASHRRTANYVTSAFGIVKHVAEERGLSQTAIDRLNVIMDDEVEHHEQRLANIFAFRRTIEEPRTRSEKYVGTTVSFADIPILGSTLPVQARAKQSDQQAVQYWRRIRHELLSWFGMGIDELSMTLGLSYATVANLGKRRPQGRTIRPVLRVYGLAKSVLGALGEDIGRVWLAGDGKDLLRASVDQFEAAVNKRLFARPAVPRVSIPTTAELTMEWPDAVANQRNIDVF